MFRTDLLSIIRSLNNVYTGTGICHASYVDSLLERSGWSSILTSLADRFLMMDSRSVRNMQSCLSKWIWEIVSLVGFYCKNISRCTVLWMSNSMIIEINWVRKIHFWSLLGKFRRSILIMNCILLSAFLGWCINCKNMRGMSKTNYIHMLRYVTLRYETYWSYT